jgi:hypothetical protein
MIVLASGIASRAVNRIGARPLLIAGSAMAAGGMFWLSRIGEHGTYADGLLGPMLITAAVLGLLFVPMSLVSLTRHLSALARPSPASTTVTSACWSRRSSTAPGDASSLDSGRPHCAYAPGDHVRSPSGRKPGKLTTVE